METPLTPFGERLLKAIHEGDWTQTSFETAAGFVRGRISRLLTLPQSKYDTETLKLFRDMLDVRLEWLLWGEEPMHDPNAPLSVTTLRLAKNMNRGTPYRVLVKVREESAAIAEAEQWDEARWLQEYLTAGAELAKEQGVARAQKYTKTYQKKRTERLQSEIRETGAKAVASRAQSTEPHPDSDHHPRRGRRKSA